MSSGRAVGRSGADGIPLEIVGVSKRYGAGLALDDVSFYVRPGRVTAFLGPNGAGKSTTMKILLDLVAATSGRAAIGGARYRDLPHPARTVGAALESTAFHPGRSGRNHLLIAADASDVPLGRVTDMLDEVGLGPAADRRVGSYSLGMRQRLSLAAALLGDPAVLVLDEPANGLDPQGIRAMRDMLRRRAAEGGTVFVSSHLLSEVEHLADDVVVLRNGRLVTAGALETLQTTAMRVRTPSPTELAAALTQSGATVERAGDSLVVRGRRTDEIGDIAFRAGVAVHELARSPSSLEELFMSWTETSTPGPGL